MGKFGTEWPLIKILDIGGAAVEPTFAPGQPETPPIPAHVHAGDVICGECTGKGKLEAYFFPPVDVPPYHMDLAGSVHSRFGVAEGVTQGQVIKCLKCGFAVDDSLYALLGKCGLFLPFITAAAARSRFAGRSWAELTRGCGSGVLGTQSTRGATGPSPRT